MELDHIFTNLVKCKALNDHTFGTVLSNCQRADISQQVSDLFIINLQATNIKGNRSRENNLSLKKKTREKNKIQLH